MKFLSLSFILLAFSLPATLATAAVVPKTALSSISYPITYFGVDADGTVGFSFTPSSTLEVSSLGFFDTGHDGIVTDHLVGLFEMGGPLLGLTVVDSSSYLNGDFRYTQLDDTITLQAGHSYLLAGTTAGPEDGWVWHVGSWTAEDIVVEDFYYSPLNVVVRPRLGATDGDTTYLGFNFEYTIAAVPEPETYAMLASGVLLLGLFRRRSRNRQV